MTYQDLVMKFLYESFPATTTTANIKFEAISTAVFGTKQRRFGPMPPPEVQVAVRDIIRDAQSKDYVIRFFLPWAASKQGDGQRIDILELMALRQLMCLKSDMEKYGLKSEFSFRLEDHTDRWLFGDDRLDQIVSYVNDFAKMTEQVLPGSKLYAESDFATWGEFQAKSAELTMPFYRVLKGLDPDAALERVGWMGGIPQEQREYYYAQYRLFYPGQDHEKILAKYFAAALARKLLKATAVPSEKYVFLTFAHPVPNDPVRNNRLYLRTLPERFTNKHKSPWLATGYCELHDDGECVPKFVERDTPELAKQTVKWQGVEIDAPYLLK